MKMELRDRNTIIYHYNSGNCSLNTPTSCQWSNQTMLCFISPDFNLVSYWNSTQRLHIYLHKVVLLGMDIEHDWESNDSPFRTLWQWLCSDAKLPLPFVPASTISYIPAITISVGFRHVPEKEAIDVSPSINQLIHKCMNWKLMHITIT